MTKYRGNYPKNVNSIYSLTAGGYGATLNDGTLVKLNVRALNHNMPKLGQELPEGSYEVIGQSKVRSA